jgi:DNA-binding NarL/FixJ family response regulator
LRQYAAEQLAQNAEEVQRTHDAHAAYYMQFLEQRELAFGSARQRETIQEMEADIDNIRAAWRRAVAAANVALLQKGRIAYYRFCDMQGRYQEGSDAIEKAIESLESMEFSEERDFTLAHLQNMSGSWFFRLGQFEEARLSLLKSISLYQHIGRRPPHGLDTEPLSHLGLLAVIVGDYDAAVAYGEEALNRIDASDKRNLSFALYVLATATYSQAQPEAALGYAQKSYEISYGMGDKLFSAYVLIVMGNIAQALEEYDKAWEYYRTSYQFKQEANEVGGVAFALNCMARIAWLRQDYSTAKRLFQEGHDLYRDVHDPGGLATSIFGLGDTAQAESDYATARTHFYRALLIAADIRWTPLILAIVAGVSEFLLKTGEAGQAAEYVTMVAQHPASDPPTRRRAEQLLKRTKPRGEIADLADLDTTARRLCDQLKEPKVYSLTEDSRAIKQKSIDALTAREREVAILIGKGKSNQEIADTLIVGYRTVETHVSHILSKLGFNARTQIALWTLEKGLLQGGSENS